MDTATHLNMKTLLISLALAISPVCALGQDQGVSVRSTNGYLQASPPYRVVLESSAARIGLFNGSSTGSNLRAVNGAISIAELLSTTNCLPYSLAGSFSAGRFQGATTTTNVATVGSAAFGDYLNAISCTTTSTLGSIAASELEASANSHNMASDASLSLLSASASSNVNVFALNGSSAHIYAPGVTNASLTANGAIVMGTLANNTTNNVTNSIAFVGSGGIAGLINASGFTGNGAGLTNLNGASVLYATNQANGANFNAGNVVTSFNTNDNFTISALTGLDTTGTNVSWGLCVITNSAGASNVKTIQLPTAWVDIGNNGSSTLYNTNQGALFVFVPPGMGTNFIWRGK